MAANTARVCKKLAHLNCKCDYYCNNCKRFACIFCKTTEKHPNHDFYPSDEAVTQYKNEVNKSACKIDKAIKSLSEGYHKIELMDTEIQRQGEDVIRQIDKLYNELERKLQEQRGQVEKQVHDAVAQKRKVLREQLTQMDQVKKEILSMREMYDALLIKPPKGIFDAMDNEQLQKIDNCSHKLINRKINLQPQEINNIELVLPLKSLLPQFCYLSVGSISTNSELLVPDEVKVNSKVTATLLTKDADGHYCSVGGNKVSMQLKESIGEIKALKVIDKNDGSYVASFQGEQDGKAKLHVSINGQEIKGSPFNIVLLKNYRYLRLPDKVVTENGRMGKPWAIALGKYGIWALTENVGHCARIFDCQNQLVKKFGSEGTKQSQFKSPCGIAFDNDNRLYVADTGNNRVQKFDINGKYLLQFGGQGSGEGELNTPYGITTHNDRVYVADSGNHRISVFQYNGQFCISFGSRQLDGPYDVAVSVNNQLLVADHNNHSIFTFTLDGRHVDKFATQGSDRGQLYHPYSLAIDVNGFILVTDNNHRLSIFDRAYNITHCYGSRGSENGQFDFPVGIALSPNGSIYISDHENKRVQIFTNY